MTRLLLLSFCAILLGGCASSRSGDVYSRDQARREMIVRLGTIESVRPVVLEGTDSGTGSMAGVAIGGVAGSSVGGGKGQIIGAIIGAIAGGLAGNAIEENATQRNAVEITVRLDSGKLIAIVQEGDPMAFRPGDRVRVISNHAGSRVSH